MFLVKYQKWKKICRLVKIKIYNVFGQICFLAMPPSRDFWAAHRLHPSQWACIRITDLHHGAHFTYP